MNPARRKLILSSMAAALAARQAPAWEDTPKPDAAHDEKELRKLTGWEGNETIAMVVYPKFTALDLFGPHHMFINMMGARVMLVGETREPVETDTGVRILPSETFESCPKEVTILFVPGGTLGTLAAAENPRVLDFLRSRGERAAWITSVCTGSLVLGAAGLLKGYRATSHWLARPKLSLFGATPVDERVVIDRNRVTGAGVTSGLDFGLGLVQQLRGKDYAEAVQLFSEYDPHPPLDSGCEAKASKENVSILRAMMKDFDARVDELAKRTAPR